MSSAGASSTSAGQPCGGLPPERPALSTTTVVESSRNSPGTLPSVEALGDVGAHYQHQLGAGVQSGQLREGVGHVALAAAVDLQ